MDIAGTCLRNQSTPSFYVNKNILCLTELTVHFFSPISLFRVVAPGKNNTVSGIQFINYGSHSNEYPCAYMTAAAAIGMTKNDVDLFITRLDKVMTKFNSEKSEDSGNGVRDDVEAHHS